MGLNVQTYAMSKKYTKDTAEEFGAVKGANCQIKSIVKANNRNTVTFLWKNSQNVEQESVMIVEDGTPIYEWHSGDSYDYGDLCIYASCFYRCTTPNHDVEFDSDKWSEIGSPDSQYDIVQNSTLLPPIFTAADRKMYYSIENECFWLWNGSAWVKQRTLSQYSTMPTAGASYVGRIVQYIGATNVNYTEGYYYKCTVTGEVGSEVYSWEQINIQPPSSTTFIGTTTEWGSLTPTEQAEYEIVNIIDDNATTMLSPATPVNIGAATPVELEDYIESVAGGGGAGAWTNLGSYENCLNSTTNKNAYLQPMQNFMASSSYSEIMIVINPHGSLIHSAITLPAFLFKDIPSGGGERWFNIPCGNSALDTWTSNVVISNVQEEDESYSFKTYSNNTGSYSAFDVLFYGR